LYGAGNPLATSSKVFKGRHDLFLALERELATAAEQRPALLLFGGRRYGKTSAIKQQPVRLGPRLIPVEVDMQDAVNAEGASGLLFNLAKQIRENALTHRRLKATLADVERAFTSVLTHDESYFGQLWKDADDIQWAAMRAIALGQDVRRLGDPSTVNAALSKLVQRDILVKTANGYRFHAELVRR